MVITSFEDAHSFTRLSRLCWYQCSCPTINSKSFNLVSVIDQWVLVSVSKSACTLEVEAIY